MFGVGNVIEVRAVYNFAFRLGACRSLNMGRCLSGPCMAMQEEEAKKQEPKKDPLEEYCEDNPETDECRCVTPQPYRVARLYSLPVQFL